MFTIVTTRYNNETWEANYNNRIKRNISCLYASPHEMSPKIDLNSPVFVIEMNNSTNKIEGIGLIKNMSKTDKYYNIQRDANYNRFIYIGNYHLSRQVLEDYNQLLVYILDLILFKGYTHSKRGAGFTTIPEKVLKFEVCEGMDIKKEIKQLFLYHFREKINIHNIN
jgi:hypothetical protein